MLLLMMMMMLMIVLMLMLMVLVMTMMMISHARRSHGGSIRRKRLAHPFGSLVRPSAVRVSPPRVDIAMVGVQPQAPNSVAPQQGT